MGSQLTNAASRDRGRHRAGGPAPRARPGRDPHSRLPHPRGRGPRGRGRLRGGPGAACHRTWRRRRRSAPRCVRRPGRRVLRLRRRRRPARRGAALTAQLRVEFIRPLPAGQAWIEGRAEADAVDDRRRAGPRPRSWTRRTSCSAWPRCASIKASHQGFRASARHPTRAAAASAPPAQLPRTAQLRPVRPQAAHPARPRSSAWSAGRRTPAGRPGRSAPPPGAANSFGMVHGGVLGLLAHEVARTRSGR